MKLFYFGCLEKWPKPVNEILWVCLAGRGFESRQLHNSLRNEKIDYFQISLETLPARYDKM